MHRTWRRLDHDRGKRRTVVAVARELAGRGKRRTVVVVAVARELAGFCWAAVASAD